MRLFYFLGVLIISFSIHAKEFQTHSKVCGNPDKPCQSASYEFQPHELSFKLPNQLEWQSGYHSAEFYAVILRSVKARENYNPMDDQPCVDIIDESERLNIQTQFPNNKVFASRNGCGTMVFYTHTDEKYNFVAVYAGNNKNEANTILEQAKQLGFNDASLRQMQVIVDNGD